MGSETASPGDESIDLEYQDFLVEMVRTFCPVCSEEHLVEVRKRLTWAEINSEKVNYFELYCLCPVSNKEEIEFIPVIFSDENDLRTMDAYRSQKGLLTSKEIAEIRGCYGLTQSEFSLLLGWEEIAASKFESKDIQDETQDIIMRMICQNPLFAFENLEKHRVMFMSDRYNCIRKNISERYEEHGSTYLSRQKIKGMYLNYQEPNELNGYKVLDIDKTANMMGYFSRYADNLYKVKLMLLLCYTDFLFFKMHDRSMTGLMYRHTDFGVFPAGFDELLCFPTVKVMEEMGAEDIRYLVVPGKPVSVSDFSLDELHVLLVVANNFKSYGTGEIIDYFRSEWAYKETQDNMLIPYSLAKNLSELE